MITSQRFAAMTIAFGVLVSACGRDVESAGDRHEAKELGRVIVRIVTEETKKDDSRDLKSFDAQLVAKLVGSYVDSYGQAWITSSLKKHPSYLVPLEDEAGRGFRVVSKVSTSSGSRAYVGTILCTDPARLGKQQLIEWTNPGTAEQIILE